MTADKSSMPTFTDLPLAMNDTRPLPICELPPWHNHLVISQQSFHSARALCAHPRTYGPSMAVVPESLFCDMSTRRLHEICSELRTDQCCFDIELMQMMGCAREPGEIRPCGHGQILPMVNGTGVDEPRFTRVMYW